MLAFTRRPNESFLIGEEVVVKVLSHDGNGNIQFGVELPKSVSVQLEKALKIIAREE